LRFQAARVSLPVPRRDVGVSSAVNEASAWPERAIVRRWPSSRALRWAVVVFAVRSRLRIVLSSRARRLSSALSASQTRPTCCW
jgi:hypothetical protein